jgi:hypothetical protein
VTLSTTTQRGLHPARGQPVRDRQHHRRLHRDRTNLINKVVTTSHLPAAVKAQLIASLQSLTAGFDPNNLRQRATACVKLKAFISLVRFIAPPHQAAEWAADATRIRVVLAC